MYIYNEDISMPQEMVQRKCPTDLVTTILNKRSFITNAFISNSTWMVTALLIYYSP